MKVKDTVADYLARCRVRGLTESVENSMPPTAAEVRALIKHLRLAGLQPAVVGDAAVAHYVGRNIRPALKVNIFVSGPLPAPPPGWRPDVESAGLPRWIAPSGGVVDFILAGHMFPGGSRAPSALSGCHAANSVIPVALPKDIFLLKLASWREKDLADAVALARATGLPTDAEFGKLSPQQKDSLNYVKLLLRRSENARIS